jgi:hypothetical protein
MQNYAVGRAGHQLLKNDLMNRPCRTQLKFLTDHSTKSVPFLSASVSPPFIPLPICHSPPLSLPYAVAFPLSIKLTSSWAYNLTLTGRSLVGFLV